MVRLGFQLQEIPKPLPCLEALSMLIVNKLRGGLKVRWICSVWLGALGRLMRRGGSSESTWLW